MLGLSLLAKAGFDPSEGDDPLLERSAHSFPLSLLPTESKEGVELLSGNSGAGDDETRRKGRGGFKGTMTADLPDDSTPQEEQNPDTWNLKSGIDPNARIAIRYATEADKQLRQQAKQSEWYKRNGRQAGKERASQPRRFGQVDDGGDGAGWSFKDRDESGAGSGSGREFAKRIGRERRTPYDRDRRGGPGGGRKDQSDLDRELDGMVKRRMGQEGDGGDVDMDTDIQYDRQDRRRGGGGGGGGRGGGQRRERRGVDDLDKGTSCINTFPLHVELELSDSCM